VEVNMLRLGRIGRLEVASLSDVGCVRENNEDSLGVYPGAEGQGPLLVVADGMGGAVAGEVASRLAVDGVHRAYFDRSAGLAADKNGNGTPDGDTGAVLIEAVLAANRDVFDRARREPALRGMGTTCTAVAVSDEGLVVGHVGDSRAYLVSEGRLTRLTRDHTLAEALARRAGGPPETIPPEAHNILTRCLGVEPEARVDLDRFPPAAAGDRLLMCSDGLTGMVDDDLILETVAANDPGEACRKLVEAAKREGGIDNVSVVVARFLSDEDSV